MSGSLLQSLAKRFVSLRRPVSNAFPTRSGPLYKAHPSGADLSEAKEIHRMNVSIRPDASAVAASLNVFRGFSTTFVPMRLRMIAVGLIKSIDFNEEMTADAARDYCEATAAEAHHGLFAGTPETADDLELVPYGDIEGQFVHRMRYDQTCVAVPLAAGGYSSEQVVDTLDIGCAVCHAPVGVACPQPVTHTR